MAAITQVRILVTAFFLCDNHHLKPPSGSSFFQLLVKIQNRLLKKQKFGGEILSFLGYILKGTEVWREYAIKKTGGTADFGLFQTTKP